MSTKIHHAWRCDLKNLTRATDLLAGRIRKAIVRTIPKDNLQYPALFDEFRQDPRKFAKHYGEAGLHVFIDQEKGRRPRAYIIAYCPWNWAPSNPLPKWLEEYHYQNSSDGPKNIPPRAWEARRRNWDRIAFDNDAWHKRKMTLRVLDDYMVFEKTLFNAIYKTAPTAPKP